jgi:phosphosulfolactate synthase (CoM biosynthesis protein A)
MITVTGIFHSRADAEGALELLSIVSELGLEKAMFEAADPEVFAWYSRDYGPEVNLFVAHSQIVQLEALRAGIWGTKSLWGRIVTYKDR